MLGIWRGWMKFRHNWCMTWFQNTEKAPQDQQHVLVPPPQIWWIEPGTVLVIVTSESQSLPSQLSTWKRCYPPIFKPCFFINMTQSARLLPSTLLDPTNKYKQFKRMKQAKNKTSKRTSPPRKKAPLIFTARGLVVHIRLYGFRNRCHFLDRISRRESRLVIILSS